MTSYTDALAKDRDKYRRQRNKLAGYLRTLVAAAQHSTCDSGAVDRAREALAEIDREIEAAERILG